ncbi:hypothetical protein IF650_09525 [Cellulosimicrobium terreum]|nr:hypothetical protein [Cellulosimicrobium terreum]
MSRRTPSPGSPDDRPDSADSADAATPAEGAGRRPPAVVALVAGVGLEIIALTVAGVVVLVELVAGGSSSLGVSLFLVVFSLGVALVLAASLRALLRGQRWGRSPVATWQILQIVVAVSSLQADGGRVALPLGVAIALAVVVLVLMVLKPVVEATTRDSRPTG